MHRLGTERTEYIMSENDAQIEDDETPRAALEAAGQAIRTAIHRTDGRPLSPGARDGWQYPSDVYRCLGELTYLAGGLTQVIEQLSGAVVDQHLAGHVGFKAGDIWAGKPDAAVTAAADAFQTAADNAALTGAALTAAQTILSGAEYVYTSRRP